MFAKLKPFKLLLILFILIAGTTNKSLHVRAEKNEYLRGNELSDSTRKFLTDHGITINEKSIITLSETVDHTESGYCLIVRNIFENHNEISAVAMYDQNNQLILSNLSQLTSTSIQFPWNLNFAIFGTAYYYQYDHDLVTTWYRPVRLESYYTQSGSSANVTHFKVQYFTTGEVFTYPGFIDTGNYTTHEIYIDRSNPVPGVTYATYYTPYLTNYVIHAFGGSIYAGCMLTFTYTANGVTDGTSIYFY